MGRVACIDYGLARMGLAISDETKIIATSLGQLKAEKTCEANVQLILKALASYKLDTIIIGLPLYLNGKKGFLADEVHHFIAKLQTMVPYPVIAWDERLSTVQADRALREANLSRKKRSQVVDTVTAVILLQCYLEKLSFEKEFQQK